MPGTENMWAFTIVTVILVALGIGLIIWFKKIKWFSSVRLNFSKNL
jgi:Mg2+ and Co2+ transporter CorA